MNKIICKNCHNEVDSKELYCPYCGEYLEISLSDEELIKDDSCAPKDVYDIEWVKELKKSNQKGRKSSSITFICFAVMLVVSFLIMLNTMIDNSLNGFIVSLTFFVISSIGFAISGVTCNRYCRSLVKAMKFGNCIVAVDYFVNAQFYVNGKRIKSFYDPFKYSLPNGTKIVVAPTYRRAYGRHANTYLTDVQFFIAK